MAIKQNSYLSNWRLWSLWVFANITGWAIVAGVTIVTIGAIGAFFTNVITQTNPGIAFTLIFTAIGAIIIFGFMGGTITWFLEWLTLRRQYIPKSLYWIFFSFIGWILGLYLGGQAMILILGISTFITPPENILTILILVSFPTIVGLSLGVMQYLVLEQFTPLAGWWVPINAIGMPTALIIVILVRYIFVEPVQGDKLLALVVYGGIFGMIFGAITGSTLLWFLNNPSPEMRMVIDWLEK